MRQRDPIDVKPWMLPALVAAIVVPAVLATALAGPGWGLGAAAVVAVLLVYAAIRLEPRRGPR